MKQNRTFFQEGLKKTAETLFAPMDTEKFHELLKRDIVTYIERFGALNYVEHLARLAPFVAIEESEDGSTVEVSLADVRDEVRRLTPGAGK